MSEILVGVSACLLGEHVRYDGGHKRNAFLLEQLAPHVHFVPVCPEVGIGLGVPREGIRLVRRGDRVRLLGPAGVDHAAAMRRWAVTVTGALGDRGLSGFVLKQGSPSCGLERVRVWDEGLERPSRSGRGVFAQALVDAMPELAIEEEGRLNDPGLREHFVDRIFAHARVRDFFAAPWTSESLIRFHSAEKAALMAHDAEAARRLGRLVAGQRRLEPERLARSYRALHAAAHARPATPGRQANALLHLAGHLKGELGSCDRQELREAIDDYRIGLLPIAVPLALLSRHLRAVGTDWARSQTYLRPYPKQLGLRGVISKPRRRRSAAPSAKPKSPSLRKATERDPGATAAHDLSGCTRASRGPAPAAAPTGSGRFVDHAIRFPGLSSLGDPVVHRFATRALFTGLWVPSILALGGFYAALRRHPT